MFACCTGIALIAFFTLRPLGACCTGITFVALVSFRALFSRITFRAFEVWIIFQSIFIQRNQYPFVAFTANFLRFQAIAKVKLQIANRHIRCNLGAA